MVDSLAFTLFLGTVLGFLSGIGVGGGSLLMLWLTIAMEMPQAQARGINLLFFLPAALVSCIFRWKQGVLDWRAILPAVIAGCLSAAVFSWLGTVLNTVWIQKCFGVLLILTGLRELFAGRKKGGSA